MGLGLLAGAGAIVDYWPVNGAWPSVQTVAAFRPVRPASLPQLAGDVPAPPVTVITPRHTVKARPASTVFAQSFQAVRFAEPVTTAVPEAPALPELDLSGIQPDLPVAILAMTAVDLDLEFVPAEDVKEPLPGVGASSSRGFVNSAVGALNALKKTRASLRDAVRGVVGTVRKVSPFWDTTAATSTFR
jgi:hypothetical protein